MLRTKYLKKTCGSASVVRRFCTTLPVGRTLRAKSSASDVLPVPARPLMMVDMLAAIPFSSVLNNRDRETRGMLVGGTVLSFMSLWPSLDESCERCPLET